MKVTIYHKTEQSRQHASNQDYYIYAQNPWHQMLFAIADGVGSLTNSQIASQYCCEILKQHFLKTNFTDLNESDIENWGKHLVEKTIFQTLQKALEPISTTLSFVIVCKNQFYVFHVGNTRVFQIKNHKTHQITTDHVQTSSTLDTFSWLKRENILNNFISNKSGCFVDFTVLPFDIDGLLLTTDGIHDFVTMKDLVKLAPVTGQSSSSSLNLAYLFKQAYLGGSLDDKTALWVTFVR